MGLQKFGMVQLEVGNASFSEWAEDPSLSWVLVYLLGNRWASEAAH